MHYGFTTLPSSLKLTVKENSMISGVHRSDNIITYKEVLIDGSYKTFNFYSSYGPEQMKASFYYSDRVKNEETSGILTIEDRWYFRISTNLDFVYCLRIEREKPRL